MSEPLASTETSDALRVLWMKSDDILPPDTGGKIRTYNLMRGLHRRCEVEYAFLRDPSAPAAGADTAVDHEEVAQRTVPISRAEEDKQSLGFYARVLKGMLSTRPYIVQKYRADEFAGVQRRFVERAQADGVPAVILCDFLEMADNVDFSLPVPKVLFQHNVESEIWTQYWEKERNPAKRLYFDFERRRMSRYEAAICNRFDLVLAVTAEDKDRMSGLLGVDRPIEVLETGVDVDFFAPRPDLDPQPGRLVFLGSLDWMPNIDGVEWFFSDVYPKIRAQNPHASVDVVGRRPVEAVRAAVEGQPDVRILADVPDVRPSVAGGDLFIVPLRVGGGSRIKIYEAMAMGRPVVSTTLGAQGLPLTPGDQIAIGDGADGFANEVNRLLADAEAKEVMGARGARFVDEHCRWEHVCAFLHAQLQQLCEPRVAETVFAATH